MPIIEKRSGRFSIRKRLDRRVSGNSSAINELVIPEWRYDVYLDERQITTRSHFRDALRAMQHCIDNNSFHHKDK